MNYLLTTRKRMKLKNLAKEIAGYIGIENGILRNHYELKPSEERQVFKLRYVYISKWEEKIDFSKPEREYSERHNPYIIMIRTIATNVYEIDYLGGNTEKLEEILKKLSRYSAIYIEGSKNDNNSSHDKRHGYWQRQ